MIIRIIAVLLLLPTWVLGLGKTFDATANGFTRSEGSSALTLMPLSMAQAQGRRILAVVRGGQDPPLPTPL